MPARPAGRFANQGMIVAQSASLSAAIAGRYAQAVFDIAQGDGALDTLSTEVAALSGTLDASAELRAVLSSPAYSRDDQANVVAAVAAKLNLAPTLKNTLALMARNGRLFALPALLVQLSQLIAEARGEVTAEIVSAQALTAEQTERLTGMLAEKSGKTIKLNTRVDESLIGGMIVKLGSRMIDSSIRSKLASLQNIMKEVG